jgi:hypothetical protein
MADISGSPGSQSGEEINPAQIDLAEHKDHSLSEKAESYDPDEEAVRITDEDLNHKEKQVLDYLKILQAS